jgi:transposase
MLTLPPAVKVFLAVQPADMRKSFDGLAALTREVLQEEPLSGHLFVFRSRSGDKIKLLFWDRSGFVLWYKRLEAGRFRFPPAPDESGAVQISASELTLILEGIDLAGARRHKRYQVGPR